VVLFFAKSRMLPAMVVVVVVAVVEVVVGSQCGGVLRLNLYADV
jgi:hypothetical protein